MQNPHATVSTPTVSPTEIFAYLDQLDEVFVKERTALQEFDRRSIERVTQDKLHLDRKLQQAIQEFAQDQAPKDPKTVLRLQQRMADSRQNAQNNLDVLESYSRQVQHLRNKLTGVETQGYHPRKNNAYQKKSARPLLTDSIG